MWIPGEDELDDDGTLLVDVRNHLERDPYTGLIIGYRLLNNLCLLTNRYYLNVRILLFHPLYWLLIIK